MNCLSVAVVCDYLEEGWESMNLVGDMLLKNLHEHHADSIVAERVCPPMNMRFANLVPRNQQRRARNADRLVNRFYDYPRVLRRLQKQENPFDIFHLVDHSYSQLVHVLPAARAIVTCHDLDTFRSILEPQVEIRSPLFRLMTKRTLDGFRQAAHVTCDSQATCDGLLDYQLLPPERVSVIPLGVHPTCSPEPDAKADEAAAMLLGAAGESIELLHVGSTIPRKRIDVLLHIFAGLLKRFPAARLVRVGGKLSTMQQNLAEELGINHRIVTLPFIDRCVLAAVYRRAALVLLPSEQEGFGLPVVEAMACGTPVVASDLPVLREVGGDAAIYCSVAEISGWVKATSNLLQERKDNTRQWAALQEACIAQASRFSWTAYTNNVVKIYQKISGR